MRKLVVAALAGSVALLAACSSAPARDGVKVVRYDVRSRFVHRTLIPVLTIVALVVLSPRRYR